MNQAQAYKLLQEIYDLMTYAPSAWDAIWRLTVKEVRAGDIDGTFLEIMARLDALGALHPELDRIINDLIRDQIYQFYQALYKKRKPHLFNGYVYSMEDVWTFLGQAKPLFVMLVRKVDSINSLSNAKQPYKLPV